MSQPAKAQEPTMEEILASIRRIIADDDAAKPAPPAAKAAPSPAAKNSQDDIDAMLAGFDAVEAEAPAEAPSAAPDVLELTESMQAKPAFNTIEGPPDVVFSEPPPPVRPPAPPLDEPEPFPERPLLSPRTTAAVDMAFNSLAHTVLVQNSRTLEDLVREMLKPMLKAWLDDNLPNMVERLVRAEIERVSRGRG
jgi:cell pole-organizing protein PopZ